MPIQAPHWTDYLNCPVCCREFGPSPRSPISLGCGHTLCEHCLTHIHRKHCPFDQTAIQAEPEELAINTALLQLAGYTPPTQPLHPPSIQALCETDRKAYDAVIRCLEHLAIYLKLCANNSIGNRLSRPMQRKLVTLLQCSISDEEGRGRAARAARSLGERSVTELILQHQNPQQLSAHLWAAVRARGCQFLGPAMQEEVLKLVLLALEDGSALSRKVLVMFVVQRLEGDFPQASKTSIGHVVQLLYRASCFKVSKRECDSSLMQLKEEFRTYESLRREHDAQIVQIATEAGLRIAPDQWSALLYGDTAHKSHMQSIIDKLQTPQSFAQSVQELFIALQRSGDPGPLVTISLPLERLASIDPSPDAKSPSWPRLAEIIMAMKEVVSGLVNYLQQQNTGRDANHNQKHPIQDKCSETSQQSPQDGSSPPQRYKNAHCRDSTTRSGCPRGQSCSYLHFDDEFDNRFRPAGNQSNGNYNYVPPPPVLPPMTVPPPTHGTPVPMHIYQRFPPPPLPQQQHSQMPHMDTYGQHIHSLSSPMSTIQTPAIPPEIPLPNQTETSREPRLTHRNYASALMHNPQQMAINQNNMQMLPNTDRPYYGRYGGGLLTVVTEEVNNVQYQRPEYLNTVYQAPQSGDAMSSYHNQENIQPASNLPSSMYIPLAQDANQYAFDEVTGSMPVADNQYYGWYGRASGSSTAMPEENNVQYTRPDYINQMYLTQGQSYYSQETIQPMQNAPCNMYMQMQPVSPGDLSLSSDLIPDYRKPPGFTSLPHERRAEAAWNANPNDPFARPCAQWSTDPMSGAVAPYRNLRHPGMPAYDFSGMRDALPPLAQENLFAVSGDRRVVGVDRIGVDRANMNRAVVDRASVDRAAAERAAMDRAAMERVAMDRVALDRVGLDRAVVVKQTVPKQTTDKSNVAPTKKATTEADEHQLEEELLALERRIDTEF